jgi:hypothetical protein
MTLKWLARRNGRWITGALATATALAMTAAPPVASASTGAIGTQFANAIYNGYPGGFFYVSLTPVQASSQFGTQVFHVQFNGTVYDTCGNLESVSGNQTAVTETFGPDDSTATANVVNTGYPDACGRAAGYQLTVSFKANGPYQITFAPPSLGFPSTVLTALRNGTGTIGTGKFTWVDSGVFPISANDLGTQGNTTIGKVVAASAT